ncbi:MAG: ATP-binding cassette domain-containing protein [Bacteroidota bacterium]
MIAVRDIWKRFGEHLVLRGVSFDVLSGETLVVLGKSGGGKSILLKLIVGLLRPDDGSIVIDGHDVVTMDYRQLQRVRSNFGFLFQGAALFDSLTVRDNIALALRRRAKYTEHELDERVTFALSMVGLEGVERELPASLSGGMKKRVGLARAIAPNPRYILYDEPTTGLDMETADGINLLINELRAKLGVTSIVVTHDIHSAFVVGDRFVVLDEGVVLISGTRKEIESSRDEDVRKYINSSLSAGRVNPP